MRGLVVVGVIGALSFAAGCGGSVVDCGDLGSDTIEGTWTRSSDNDTLVFSLSTSPAQYVVTGSAQTSSSLLYQVCPQTAPRTALIRYDPSSNVHYCNPLTVSAKGDSRSLTVAVYDQTICAAAETGCGEDPALLSATPPDKIDGVYTMKGCGP